MARWWRGGRVVPGPFISAGTSRLYIAHIVFCIFSSILYFVFSFYLCWHHPVIHCPHCEVFIFIWYFLFNLYLVFLSLLAPPGYTFPTLWSIHFHLIFSISFLSSPFITLLAPPDYTLLVVVVAVKYSFSSFLFRGGVRYNSYRIDPLHMLWWWYHRQYKSQRHPPSPITILSSWKFRRGYREMQ